MKSLFTSIKELFLGKKPEPKPTHSEAPVTPHFVAPYKVEPQPPVVEPAPSNVVTPEIKAAPEAAPAVEAKPKRARSQGKFKGDDKLTAEVNEAWEGGKAPAKKAKPAKASKPKTEKTKLKVVKAEPANKKSTKKK